MKVLFLTNVPSPYRVEFFNELGKYCELTVLFEKNTSEERDASWSNYTFENFKGIFLKGKSYKTDGAICFGVLKYLKRRAFDHIVVTNFSSPTGMLAIEFMRLKGIKYFLESDGGFAKNNRGLKEKIKRHFIKGAKGYFSTADEHDKYYLAYGAKKEALHRYPFTSLKGEDILLIPPTSEEKNALKKELDITEEKVVLCVGQFIKRKGIDLLINAAKTLPENVGVYIVGGTPTEEYILLKGNAQNIHFVGFKLKEELKKYYKAANIFVLPTREDIWGLVINEAMSLGLPVITTNKCIAGLELTQNDYNGYIISVDDQAAISEKILKIINEKTEAEFSQNSLNKIFGYTFAEMAAAHIKVFSRG